MSNRYNSNRQEGNKEGFGKTHKKFVPKNQNSSPKEPNPNPNSNPTLSNSLRQSLSKQSDGATASSSVEAPKMTRIRMGENGEWVSSGRAQGGNFVNYLPQDEAVAAGLNANEGGLDPVESQRVVDLLNRELSQPLSFGVQWN
jgi:activating signal cointegrator complex subunit 2